MRKFTPGKLEIRKLDNLDITSLIIFLIIVAGRFYLDYFSFPEMYKFYYDLVFAFIIFLFLTGPFLIRFTSVFFSLAWLGLSVLYIVEGDRALSFTSVAFLLLYHVVRFSFVRQYDREFIPPDLGRGGYINYYSKREGISGGKEDAKYVKIIAYVGIFLIMILLFLSGKKGNVVFN